MLDTVPVFICGSPLKARDAPVATPMLGVTKVGVVASTTTPLPVVPLDRLAAEGCAADTTPDVDMEVTNWFDTAANDCTPPLDAAPGLGRSAPTMERNVGATAPPLVGPAQTKLAACVASDPVSVPAVVTGEPLTVNIPGSDRATLVTEPPDGQAVHVPVVPLEIKQRPLAPIPIRDSAPPDTVSRSPLVVSGVWAREMVPLKLEKDGCAAENTPEVLTPVRN